MMINLPCLKGSCPNFLRPIYHTLSASQAPKQGPCPMVNTDAGYSSCFFCSIVTDLHSSIMLLIYSVDAIPLQIPVSLLADVVRFRSHRLRVSVPEPCPVSNSNYHRLDRVLKVLTALFFMLLLRLMQLLAVWYPLTFFAYHSLFLSSGWYILLLISCRLSLSGTASFSAGCQPVLCNIYAIL